MKRISLILALFLSGLSIFGQDIAVLTEAPSVVSVGEQFRVTWTVNSRGGSLTPPEFKDFYLLMGPQSSFSQSTSMVNGRVTQTIKNSYTYYLQATREGEFTLGPAIYTEKKKDYQSRPVSIEVVISAGQAGTKSGSTEGQNQNSSQGEGVNSSDLYVRLLVNRTSVTMGEHIVATLKIYSRVNLSGIQEVKFPDFNGFLKTDLETPPLRALERENVNGEIYNTGVIQRFLLYPQKSGTLNIEPSTLTVLLQERSRSNDPFFGDFFSSFSTIPRVLATLPVNIEVSPLPGGAPETFYGCVGSVNISSSISADTVTINEAITLRVNLSGKGNLKLSSPPEFTLSPDIEIYDPRIESDIRSTSNGNEGSKVFEYVLIPRHHGQFEIPPIEYTYFDPDRGAYRTLKTTKHNFFVKKGVVSDEETQVFGAVSKENITYLGRDIRYIHTAKVKLKKTKQVIISRSSFIILYLSSLLLFAIIIIWRREHLKRNSDIIKVKNRKAAKLAASRLKTASKFLKEENDEEFFSEILKGLWGYLSDKLSIPVADLNLNTASAILKEKEVRDETIAIMRSIIESCEYSRYSPTGESRSNKEIFKSAEELIKAIENET